MIIYGMGGSKLFETLINPPYNIPEEDLSVEKCDQMVADYLKGRPGVRDFIQRQHLFAQEYGYVTTILGRKRRLQYTKHPGPRPGFGDRAAFDAWRDVMRRYEGDMRIAVNTPVQGSAADLMKMMMIRVYRRIESGEFDYAGKRCKLLTQVHDELNFECAEETAEALRVAVQDEMAEVGRTFNLRVPIVGEGAVGANWSEAK